MNNVTKLSLLIFPLLAAMSGSVQAQDAPKVPKAKTPVQKANISLKMDAKYNGNNDVRNYVLYFTWVQLNKLDVTVANQTRFHWEKNIIKKLKTAKKLALKAKEAAKAKTDLTLSVKIDVKYLPIKFVLDGRSSMTGHKWQGTIEGTLSDNAGKELKKIKIRHSWGTNMTVARKKGQSIYMSQMSNWLMLELCKESKFRALVGKAKHADIDALVKKYSAQKKSIYDDSWK